MVAERNLHINMHINGPEVDRWTLILNCALHTWEEFIFATSMIEITPTWNCLMGYFDNAEKDFLHSSFISIANYT